jgi:erythritol kinase
MARDLIIAMDAGTSVIKALVFDFQGKQLADASRPNTYTTGSGGAVEQDMARTWTDSVAVSCSTAPPCWRSPARATAPG